MSDEKRMADSYEVTAAVKIDSTEVVLAEDTKADMPYMVANCKPPNFLGIREYTEIVVGDDYLVMLNEFTRRITEFVTVAQTEREERGISNVPLTAADCIPGSKDADYTNQVVVIKAESLTPSARTADNQIVYAWNGNGCRPNARGTAVYATALFSGEKARWERYDVAGIIDPVKMPDWAKEKLAELQKPKEKESLLAGLEAKKQEAARAGVNVKQSKKDEPDL